MVGEDMVTEMMVSTLESQKGKEVGIDIGDGFQDGTLEGVHFGWAILRNGTFLRYFRLDKIRGFDFHEVE